MWSPPFFAGPWWTATHRHSALPSAPVKPIVSAKSRAICRHRWSPCAASCGLKLKEQCHTWLATGPSITWRLSASALYTRRLPLGLVPVSVMNWSTYLAISNPCAGLNSSHVPHRRMITSEPATRCGLVCSLALPGPTRYCISPAELPPSPIAAIICAPRSGCR